MTYTAKISKTKRLLETPQLKALGKIAGKILLEDRERNKNIRTCNVHSH